MEDPYKKEAVQYIETLMSPHKVESINRLSQAITTVAYHIVLNDGSQLIMKIAVDTKDIEEGKGPKEIKAIETAKGALEGIVGVPEVIHFTESAEGFPGYITIMNKSAGETMSPQWLNEQGSSVENIGKVIEAMSALHSVTSDKVSDLATFEAENGSDYIDKYANKAYEKLKDFEEFKKIKPTIDYLMDNKGVFDNPPYHFIHRDIKHNNLLVNEGKISTIIDWEGALFVPISMDFAHVSVLAPIYGYEKWMNKIIDAYKSSNPNNWEQEQFELAEVFVALRFFMRSYEHSLSRGLDRKLASGNGTEYDLYMDLLTRY